jgi:hypothetical protein
MTDFTENNKNGFVEKLGKSNDKVSFAERVGKPIELKDNSFTNKILNKAYQDNLRGISRADYPQCSHVILLNALEYVKLQNQGV